MLMTVDTGGTKTLVATFSDDGSIAKQVKFPTPKQEIFYVSELAKTIATVADGEPIDMIVIAMPGPVKNNVVQWFGNLSWKNFDVASALKKHYPDATIVVENDANLGALGEARALDRTPPCVLYTTISTGIGMGIVTDGQLNQALRLGEGGHAVIEYDGALRDWEKVASGKAVFETYGKFGKDIHDKRTWDQIADRISRGFLAQIPLLQPDVIILGGSMGVHFAKYRDRLVGIVDEHLSSGIPRPDFMMAAHPDEAVIYGCYYYARDLTATR